MVSDISCLFKPVYEVGGSLAQCLHDYGSSTSGMVNSGMGNHHNRQGQLSLAIRSWGSTVSTVKIWGVNMHTPYSVRAPYTWCHSLTAVWLRAKETEISAAVLVTVAREELYCFL